MITELLVHFADWLGATSLARIVAENFWIVPALQTVHILSVAVVLSGVLFINLRIVGVLERGQPVPALLDRFLRPIAIALAVLAVTGLLLIAGEPTRAIFRVVFWTKMALIIVAVILTWSHRSFYSLTRSGGAAGAATLTRKAIALVALLLWLAVIVAGRWIAYVEAWPGAPA